MKTIVGKVAFAAACSLAVTPLGVRAQNIASRSGTVDRSTERFVLLPGPDLLSPARGAPQSGPSVTIVPASQVQVGAAPQMRFVPSYLNSGRWQFTPRGALKLGSDVDRRFSPPPAEKPAPGSELLRFDATLHPPSSPLKLEAVPPKPRHD